MAITLVDADHARRKVEPPPRDQERMPLVSVVIPTRNRPQLVCRAVESALNQSYPNLEIVVVIDGPDQVTKQALEALENPKVVILALSNNAGGSEARNLGARRATGDWIALLDDDDEWLPEKIERQMQLAQQYNASENVAVFCRYIYRRPGKADQIWPLRMPGNEPMSEYMFDRCSGFQTSTFFVKRAYFLERPFKNKLKGHQDWDWFLHASSDHTLKIVIDPEPQAVFHVLPKLHRTSYSFRWQDSLAWGQDNIANMTPKAYSRFIAYHCTRLAVEQRDRRNCLLPLAKECFVRGTPTAKTIAVFFAVVLLGPGMRRSIHDLLVRHGTRQTEGI